MRATLIYLARSPSYGVATVSIPPMRELMVNCDMAPGRIMQGGFFSGVLPDFACVYAAMTLTEGHTVLTKVEFVLKKAVLETETIEARALAKRIGEREIEVSCDVVGSEGELKATGKMWFLEKRKK